MDLRHSGATLKGPFSRFDYQRNQDGVSSVKSFKVRNKFCKAFCLVLLKSCSF